MAGSAAVASELGISFESDLLVQNHRQNRFLRHFYPRSENESTNQIKSNYLFQSRAHKGQTIKGGNPPYNDY